MRRFLALPILLVMLVLGPVTISLAQAPAPPSDDPVTDDQVNEVAEHLYCPVCENEPLDTCLAPTCYEWREEIRSQLADGRTEDEIITYFVNEAGEEVVGVPQDDGLRLLSFIAPIIALIVAGVVGWYTIKNWGTPSEAAQMSQPTPTPEQDTYRDQLERDLYNQ
jgi:cytochrome c-type biogenesis protein CcmH